MCSVDEFSDSALARLNAEFESRPPSEVIEWAVGSFSPHLLLAASMTDAVLIDLAVKVDPAIEVMFIDTGYHFPETMETLTTVRRRYGLNLRIMTPVPQDEEPWRTDPEGCCAALRVSELERALSGKQAWMSGLRRVDTPFRRSAPIVGRDGRGLVKVNPIAAWTNDDVSRYIDQHDVPINPLIKRGYLSIGCMPCTRPVVPGEDPRAGRWDGIDKTECGLHL